MSVIPIKVSKNNLISGITISGDLTIAHYLVVIRQLLLLQKDHNLLLFVADLHAATVNYDEKQLQKRRWQTLALYYAAGFQPEKVFVQSDILEHTTLHFLLSRFAFIGELNRMTQFKSKEAIHGKTVGLFNYPLLMAADIMLYDADVLVGPDQKQHVELTRNLVVRINNYYQKPIFHLPRLVNFISDLRIRDLQNPGKKMSKSNIDQKGIIFLTDSVETIKKKIITSVTDSFNQIRYDWEKQPGVSNLILLYALCHQITILNAEQALQKFTNYFELKTAVANAIIEVIQPLQEKMQYFLNNLSQLKLYRQQGATVAKQLAKRKLQTLAPILGFDFN